MMVDYLCYRAPAPIEVDGCLDKEAWRHAPCMPRFGKIADGMLAPFGTQAAMLWDEHNFYVSFRLDERDVWSTQEKRRGLVWQENTVEVFISSRGAYYQLSLNPMNRMSEMIFIWKDSYTRGGRYDVPEFNLAEHRPMVFGGDSGPHDPRGMRGGFTQWHFPGLQTAVRGEGALNDRTVIDRGWNVELAFPWEGMARLADGATPANDGDIWRIGLARHEVIDQRASRHIAVWTPYPMGQCDMHAPDRYPMVKFVGETVKI